MRFTDPGAEVLAEPVEALLRRWQDLGGAEAGSIEDVAAFYHNQPTGRLVVLGAPGAGKTVLLSRLVLDLLDQIDALPTGDLPAQVRVPVLLSDVSGWYVASQLILLAFFGFTVVDPRSTMKRIDLGGLRTPKGRRRLRTGLAIGLAGGLPFGNGSVWLRYAIAVRAAARHGSLPRHPARFLDWCLHTGLMRMTGTAIQFRHRRLQETLTPPDTGRVDSGLSSVPTGPPHPSAYSQE